jgi:tetratricopeptide (TPR) repeat protein
MRRGLPLALRYCVLSFLLALWLGASWHTLLAQARDWSHLYKITLAALAAGQYLNAVVEQRGIDVAPPIGRYEVKIIELRSTAVQNPALVEALKLFNESVSLRDKGNYAEAIQLAERALEIREKAQGPEHPDVAISLNYLAELYYTKGDYATAEPLFQRALAIREKAQWPEQQRVAT